MKWFNLHGLIFVAILMIPNILFALKYKNGFENNWKNKYIEVFEQIGRYGCFFTMIFNIPYTCFGYWLRERIWSLLHYKYCSGRFILPDLVHLLSEEQHVPHLVFVHSSFRTLPVQRNFMPICITDRLCCRLCTLPYPDFL